jgi:hypothetical protein
LKKLKALKWQRGIKEEPAAVFQLSRHFNVLEQVQLIVAIQLA